MAKALILAQSGFGKSSSLGKIPELKILGLDPKETFVISATSKPLPFKGSQKQYPVGKVTEKATRRYISNKGDNIAKVITHLIAERPEIKNVILDDANYVMQDYYMANAMKKGYDIFKEIGVFMDKIFSAMEASHEKNFFMLAHFEEFKDSSADTVSYRFKTVGKMTQDYITPEGKFDIVLYGKQSYDEQGKKAIKEFVTNYDGQFPAKSPVGMFDKLYIPNDLGYVTKKIEEYYG
jgi:hypothetical protein